MKDEGLGNWNRSARNKDHVRLWSIIIDHAQNKNTWYILNAK